MAVLTLEESAVGGSERAVGLNALEVSELLGQLATEDARAARVVELRCFGGLSDEAISSLLQISPRTVRATVARAKGRLASWWTGGSV